MSASTLGRSLALGSRVEILLVVIGRFFPATHVLVALRDVVQGGRRGLDVEGGPELFDGAFVIAGLVLGSSGVDASPVTCIWTAGIGTHLLFETFDALDDLGPLLAVIRRSDGPLVPLDGLFVLRQALVASADVVGHRAAGHEGIRLLELLDGFGVLGVLVVSATRLGI